MQKRSVFVTIILLVAAIGATAQIHFGALAGATISSISPLSSSVNTITGDPEDFIPGTGLQNIQYTNDQPTTRFFGGLIVQVSLSNVFRLRTGLSYAQKGWFNHYYDNTGYATGVIDNHFNVNYLQLPAELEYGTPIGKGRGFMAFGPFLAYGIGGKITTTYAEEPGSNNTFDTTYTTPLNFKYDARKWEMGFSIVMGYETSPGIFISVGYDQSLTHSTTPDGNNTGQHFTVFQLGAGYMFQPRKRGTRTRPK
jgi:hypothetical protein